MPELRRLLRLWFTFEMPVDRRRYAVSGVSLMALKYVLDAGAVALATRHVWPPLQWIHPVLFERTRGLNFSDALNLLLVAWALPFLWVGVSMTVRRAMDAGRSPWWALLFFVPGVNYLLMLALCLAPSRPEVAGLRREQAAFSMLAHEAVPTGPRVRDTLIAAGLSAAVALPLVALQTLALKHYGMGLFFGVPFAMGAIAGWWVNRREERTLRATMVPVVLGQVLLAGTLLIFALEGLLCIAMALPIGIAIACMGGVLGGAIARTGANAPAPALLGVLAMPLALALPGSGPALHEARTAVTIAAPPAVVWKHVVAFEPLAPPTEWWFRSGIAYPVRARIAGRGAGAVRRCEFSTGPFVEPITAWEEPSRLAFDVIAAPPPLAEWSPYAHLAPPHLASGFRARRGEFRLVPLADGRTRLEGSTWYALEFQPDAYWAVWSDLLVSSIHRRVLEHIRRLAEREAQGGPAAAIAPPARLDGARPALLESQPNL